MTVFGHSVTWEAVLLPYLGMSRGKQEGGVDSSERCTHLSLSLFVSYSYNTLPCIYI